MSPRRLHRGVAVAESLTWALLLLGMVLKYLTRTTDVVVSIGGGLHGFVFLTYLVTTVLVAVDGRWRAGTTLLGLGSAVLPFASIPFERWARRRDLVGERWRLPASPPGGPLERLVGALLARPLVSAAVTLVVLAVVFAVLLALGPPTRWFS
ncbi:DUF3817 domain-containing protein [Auraticoccus monumenti]|uniref:Integral membrane protein n=1 Tax=Auraticoccus monumenti TaxID=675864 RepID=A0A1G6XAN9_9ACTN|nr:DUF3817 domain-containing protein [Auraticoccus monumenti]SDD75142.1 integral membrane protein [Auraticoccus monumenti]